MTTIRHHISHRLRSIALAATLTAILSGCSPLGTSSIWVSDSDYTTPVIPYYGPTYAGSIWSNSIYYPGNYPPPRPLRPNNWNRPGLPPGYSPGKPPRPTPPAQPQPTPPNNNNNNNNNGNNGPGRPGPAPGGRH